MTHVWISILEILLTLKFFYVRFFSNVRHISSQNDGQKGVKSSNKQHLKISQVPKIAQGLQLNFPKKITTAVSIKVHLTRTVPRKKKSHKIWSVESSEIHEFKWIFPHEVSLRDKARHEKDDIKGYRSTWCRYAQITPLLCIIFCTRLTKFSKNFQIYVLIIFRE